MLTSTLTLDSPDTHTPHQTVSASRVDLNLPLPPRRLYRHGWHSWSQTGWLDPAIQVFKAYADLLRQRYGGSRLERAPRVWCSWYFLYPFVSEKHILRLLADLGDLPLT